MGRLGVDDSELMLRGAEVGRRMAGPVEPHRQHIWTEYGIERAEVALEGAGLLERTASTPAISFVDMTGYTTDRGTWRRGGGPPRDLSRRPRE